MKSKNLNSLVNFSLLGKMKNDKRGIFWIPILVGAGILGLFIGWVEVNKINTIISSIPTPFWYFIIFILLLNLLSKKK